MEDTEQQNNQDFMDKSQAMQKAAMRPVTEHDTTVLSQIRPFLEISSSEATGQASFVPNPEELAPKLLDSGSQGAPVNIRIELDWRLQYWPGGVSWPSLFAASPGNQVYYGSQPIFEEEEGYFVGTMLSQAVEVAVYMVVLVKGQNWPGVKIVAATADMQWAAWLAADYHALPIFGFEPSLADMARKKTK